MSQTFQFAGSYTTSEPVNNVTVADINGDGIPDVVVASDGELQVFIGNGSGGFAAGFTDVTGMETGGTGGTGYIRDTIAVGDFNSDGKTDIVLGLENGALSAAEFILLDGNGSGGFTPAMTFAAGTNIESIQVADLNHDGHPDLIVTEDASQSSVSSAIGILVYDGTGSGQFTVQGTYSLADLPEASAVADINGDGKPDLVVTLFAGGYEVLLGNASGGFGAAVSYAVPGGEQTAVTIADVNDDGKPDLILGSANGVVSVLLGNGSGGFGGPTTYVAALPEVIRSVVVTDVTGDGKPDLVYSYIFGTVVMPGAGNGTFGAGQTYTVLPDAWINTVADLNRDDSPDLAVASFSGGLTVLLDAHVASASQIVTAAPGRYLQTGQTATFTLTAALPLSVIPSGSGATPTLSLSNGATAVYSGTNAGGLVFTLTVAAGTDTQDLVVTGLNGNGATVSEAGTLGFAASSVTFGSAGTAITTADLNGDGKPDVIVAAPIGFEVLLGNGSGAFGIAVTYGTGGSTPVAATVADLNEDGRLDLIETNTLGQVIVRLANTSGGFGVASTYASTYGNGYATVADVNGDGLLDAVFSPNLAGGINIRLGNGAGGFSTTQTTISTGGQVHAITAADVNRDGHIDLLGVQGTSTLIELLGTSGGLFPTTTTLATFANPVSALTTADLNRDGKLDLLATTSNGAGVDVLYGNGSGGFSAPTVVFAGRQASSVLVADVNGDGIPDLVASVSGVGVLVALGVASGGFAAAVTFAPGTSAVGIATADLNQDGLLDLVTVNSGGGSSELLNTATLAQTLDPASVPGVAGANTGLVIETTGPVVTGVIANLAPIGFGVGTDVMLSVTFDQIVGVTGGVPTLALSDGGTARYITGSGSNTLVFEQSVPFNETTAGLSVTGSTGAAAITDLAGNVASLAAATGVSFGIGIASGLDVTSIKTTPASGTVGAGGAIGFSLTVSAPVTYGTTGSPPQLTLNDGGIAPYQGESTDHRTLSFAYTVKPGDSTPDLVVTGLSQPNSTFATGGTVAFSTGNSFGIGTSPLAITTADLNADDYPDLIALGASTVTVEFNNQSGGFGPASTIGVGPGTGTSLVVADVNGDSAPDLLVGLSLGPSAGAVDVLLNSGDGTFETVNTFDTPGGVTALAATDANGDGVPDLLVASRDAVSNGFQYTVSVYLGDGSGGFIAGESFSTNNAITAITTADLNGDGHPDLVLTDSTGARIVELGTASASFTAATTLFPTGTLVASTVADLNQDGIPDLVSVSSGGAVTVLLGNGSGGFTSGGTYATSGTPVAIATANLGDGFRDVLVLDSNGTVVVLPGNGHGALGAPVTLAAGPGSLAAQGGAKAFAVGVDFAGNGEPIIVQAAADGTTATRTDLSLPAGVLDPNSVPVAAGANTGLVVDGVPPAVSSPTVTVAENAPPTAIGITVSDPNYPASSLTISAGALPSDGVVTLANGTVVIAGQSLTAAQLTGLQFIAKSGAFSQTSGFSYTVRDPAGNASMGVATLAIGPALGAPVVSSPTLLVAENAPATAIGIMAPTDPNYSASSLTISAGALPSDGVVTLANGTVVIAGQSLTAAQLTGLQFVASSGAFSQTSGFSYTVRDPAGNASIGVATLAIGPAVGAPVVSSPTLSVAENAPATAIGIAAPTDPNYSASSLTISAGALPTDGVVTLANGTAVIAGQTLTAAQLTGLQFVASSGAFSQTSGFSYTVRDPAGNASMGVATLAIGPAVGAPVVSSPTLSVAENAPATAIGITAPSDPNYSASSLTISAGALPGDGVVTLANGTAVIAGQTLTAAQLTGLQFIATSGAFSQTGGFSYTVRDPAGHASVGVATLAIGPAVGAPVVSSPTVAVAENAPATAIGITAPTDPNYPASSLTISAGALPTDGVVTLANGTVVVAGQALTAAQLTGLQFVASSGAFSQTSGFSYTVRDPAGNASIGVATLAIGPAVGAPVVSSPTLSVAENAPATAIGITAPSDPNYPASSLTISAGTLPTDGVVTLANGTAVIAGQALTAAQLTGLQFVASSGAFSQTSGFSYTVRDPAGNASIGVATLAIGPAAGAPVVSSPTLSVAENAPATAIGITAPSDPNYPASSLTISAGALPTDGVVTLANGTAVIAGQALTAAQLTGLQFVASSGAFSQTSGFSYTVRDPAGNASIGVATLAIGPSLGAPVVSSPTLLVAENAPATAIGITAPTDPNYSASSLTISAGALPTDGVVTLANGTVVIAGQSLTAAQLTGLQFVASSGAFSQTSGFSYTVRDPDGNASIGVATLAIGPAFGAPVVSSPTLSVAENAPATAIGITAPSDPNYPASSLTISAGTLPTDGVVTLANGTAVIAGQALTAAQLTGLQFIASSGAFSQTSGFSYTVRDPAGNASMGVATLAIGPAVGAPVVSSPTLSVAENAPATAIGIMAPTDPNYSASSLTISAGALPTDGVVTLANGTAIIAGQSLTAAQLTGLQFVASSGAFSQTSGFSYTVRDPAGNASIGVATLAIGPAVGAPVVSSPTLSVAENAPATAIGITAPSDPNYPPSSLTISAGALPTDGVVTLANGTVVVAGQALTAAQLTGLQFVATSGAFSQTSGFSYTVRDPAGNASIGVATLAIGPAAGAPVVSSPTLLVAENAPATVIGITAPSDPNYPASSLTISAGALPTDGVVTLANGTVVIAGQTLTAAQLTGLQFIATSGAFSQTGGFSYTVRDPAGHASVGVATLAIGPAVGAPVVSSPTLSVAENAPANAIGITAPTDPNYPASSLTISAGALPTDGVVTLADGTVVVAGQALTAAQLTGVQFVATSGAFNQTSGFSYTVRDPAGNASIGVATLAIGPAVGAPVVASPVLVVAENARATAIGIAAPTDPNYPTSSLTITAGALPTDGVVTLATGTPVTVGQALTAAQLTGLQFIATSGAFSRTSGFSYSVRDPAGNASIGVATLAIGPALGSPVVSSPTLVVAENAPATAIGIAAPSDPNYPTSSLTISAGALPTDGVVTLANGTAVIAGQALTAVQLAALQFTATSGAFSQTSGFSYSVRDPAGNASVGVAALDVGLPVVNAPTVAEVPSPSLSLTQQFTGVAYAGSTVTLFSDGTKIGSAAADPVTGVYLTAATLSLGLQSVTATAFLNGVLSPLSLPITLYELGPAAAVGDVGPVSPSSVTVTSGESSIDLSKLIASGATLQFIGGAEAVQLTDGTLSIGPDTDAATVQRLYVGLLGHTGSADGVAFWTGLLATGVSKADVAAGFLGTPEYTAGHGALASQSDAQFVTSLFQGLLGHAPNAQGLAFWTSAAVVAAGRPAIVVAIADSAEAKAYIAPNTQNLYVPDPGGTLVQELFGTGLGHEVSAEGAAFWKTALAASSPLQVAQSIAGSAEFQALHASQSDAAYVNALFVAGLGRPVDPGAASFFVGGLQSGALSRSGALYDIATSGEARAHLTGSP